MKRRTGSATTSGRSAMLENFSNTILAGNFGIVCEKLSKKSIAQSLTARSNRSLITRDGDGQPQNRLSIINHLCYESPFQIRPCLYYVSALARKNKIVGKG